MWNTCGTVRKWEGGALSAVALYVKRPGLVHERSPLYRPAQRLRTKVPQCLMYSADARVCKTVLSADVVDTAGARVDMERIAKQFYILGASTQTGCRTKAPPLPTILEPTEPTEASAAQLPSPPAATNTQNVHRLRQLMAQATPSVKEEVPDGANFLVWDTETSGIGSGDVVVQLAWAICSEAGEVLRKYDRLWKLPPGRKIGWGAFKVHGISANRVASRGYTTATEVRAFVTLVRAMRKRKLRVVAHNSSFDMRMLKQTAHAHGVNDAAVGALDKRDFFCTMGAARDNCGMRNKAGRKRNPSNAELYERLLGKPPESRLHDAWNDIMVTAASYAAGKRKRWW